MSGSLPAASPHVLSLGYLGVEAADVGAWEKFATEILGLGIAARSDGGGFSLRMDSYARRFFIEPGARDDISFIGWEVADEAALASIGRRVEASGCPVTEGTRAEAAARHVASLLTFRDPAGIPTELFHGPERAAEPFRSTVVHSSFVAEARGLGHAVVSSNTKEQSALFYQDVLGFRLSDHVVCRYFGHPVDIDFFHANTRHHSVAIGGPQPKRIHHFMIEVASMDDVGLCFDRALRAGVPIVNTLGKHPNDKMFSFYGKTPSGFQFEFGWGGRDVDDATWQPTTHGRISEWGHQPPAVFASREKKQP